MSWHRDHAIHYFFNQEQDAFKPINWYFTLQHYAALLCATEWEMHPAAGEQRNLSTESLQACTPPNYRFKWCLCVESLE